MNKNFLTTDEAAKKLQPACLITIDDLAQALNVHKSWIYSRTRETGPGTLPRIKCGKYLRFQLEDVLEWLKMKTQQESE